MYACVHASAWLRQGNNRVSPQNIITAMTSTEFQLDSNVWTTNAYQYVPAWMPMAPRNAACKVPWLLRSMPSKDSDPVFGTLLIRSIFLNVGSLSGSMLKCCKCSLYHTTILNSIQVLGKFGLLYKTQFIQLFWMSNWLQAVMYISNSTLPLEAKWVILNVYHVNSPFRTINELLYCIYCIVLCCMKLDRRRALRNPDNWIYPQALICEVSNPHAK